MTNENKIRISELVRQGWSYRKIAATLNISPNTNILAFIRNLKQKTGKYGLNMTVICFVELFRVSMKPIGLLQGTLLDGHGKTNKGAIFTVLELKLIISEIFRRVLNFGVNSRVVITLFLVIRHLIIYHKTEK